MDITYAMPCLISVLMHVELAPDICFFSEFSAEQGIPRWDSSANSAFIYRPGITEHDVRDFVYFASTDGFSYWVLALPSHVDITEQDAAHWSTIARLGSAEL